MNELCKTIKSTHNMKFSKVENKKYTLNWVFKKKLRLEKIFWDAI
jgi:hypothetical protein